MPIKVLIKTSKKSISIVYLLFWISWLINLLFWISWLIRLYFILSDWIIIISCFHFLLNLFFGSIILIVRLNLKRSGFFLFLFNLVNLFKRIIIVLINRRIFYLLIICFWLLIYSCTVFCFNFCILSSSYIVVVDSVFFFNFLFFFAYL